MAEQVDQGFLSGLTNLFSDSGSKEKTPLLPSADVQSVMQAVMSGLQPGTIEFYKALNAEASQHGITPSASLGPFGGLRDKFSSDAQNLIKKQQNLATIGTQIQQALTDAFTKQAVQERFAPSLSDVQAIAPGIRPTPEQLRLAEGPRPTGPGFLEVPAEGPGLPQQRDLMETDAFLKTLSPQEIADGRFRQELWQRGKGTYQEGPRPTTLQPTGSDVELYGPGAPIQQLIPGVKANLAQLGAYQSLMAGHTGDELSPLQPASVMAQQGKRVSPSEINYALTMLDPTRQNPSLEPPESISPVVAKAILSSSGSGEKTEIREMEDPVTKARILNLVSKRDGAILRTIGPTPRAVNDLVGMEGVRDELTAQGQDPYKTAIQAVNGDKSAQQTIRAAQDRWQKRQEEVKSAGERATIAAKPMDPRDRDAITLMKEFDRHIQNIKKIPAAKLEEYVGKFSMPAHEWAQIATKDPVFAQFATDLGFLQREFFSDETAGAALTPLEYNTLRKSIPYGSEWGGMADFMAKLNEAEARSKSMIESRLQLATETRGESKQRLSGAKKSAPSDLDAKLDAAIKAMEALSPKEKGK